MSLSGSFPSARRHRSALYLFVWFVPVLIAAALGAMASVNAAGFYASLSLPGWAPPAAVFGPAWTLLYLMMAIAAWRISILPAEPARTRALVLFSVQLIVNALWSWFFFAWKLGAWAFVDVLLLLALVAACTIWFWRLDRPAAVLFLPYLLWVGFASALSGAVWLRNPALLGG